MSDLYRVFVDSKTKSSASLNVHVVHPDAMRIPADPSFGLMLLREAATDRAPIAAEVAISDVMDATWARTYARGFIRSVVVKDKTNQPPAAALRSNEHAYWEKRPWMSATVVVTVTDPAWLAHLKVGQHWTSTAYQSTQSYKPHAAIAPNAKPATVTSDDAFVWVPREVFASHAFDELPELLEMLAYSTSCYRPGKLDKVTTRARRWLGKAVVATDGTKTVWGTALTLEDGQLRILQFSGTGYMGQHLKPTLIGRPALKARHRGTPLGAEKILGAAWVMMTASKRVASKRGATLEITLRVPPDGRELPIQNKTDALAVLVTLLVGHPDKIGEPLGSSALATALDADLAANGMDFNRIQELLPGLASKYITAFTLDYTKVKGPVRSVWPEATLRVIPSDPRWIAHCAIARPVFLRERSLPAPRPLPPRRLFEGDPPPDERTVMFKDDRVWIAERRGHAWTARHGKCDRSERQMKSYASDSAERAHAALAKAVAGKLKDGYRAAPQRAEALAIIRKRLGLTLVEVDGMLAVTEADARVAGLRGANADWFKPEDHVETVQVTVPHQDYRVSTVEEVAGAIAGREKGDRVGLDSRRPSSGWGTWIHVVLE